MELTMVPIVKPDAANFIFGQSHFIKTVEDLHEALVGAVPGIPYGQKIETMARQCGRSRQCRCTAAPFYCRQSPQRAHNLA
jgi:adenosine/AMP kinase